MRDLQRATRTTVKCGSVRVVNEDLSGMSLAEVGLALKSHLLAPRSEPATLVANFVLRHSGLERGEGCRKTFSPFPLSTCPTAAELSLSLEAGRAQLESRLRSMNILGLLRGSGRAQVGLEGAG